MTKCCDLEIRRFGGGKLQMEWKDRSMFYEKYVANYKDGVDRIDYIEACLKGRKIKFFIDIDMKEGKSEELRKEALTKLDNSEVLKLGKRIVSERSVPTGLRMHVNYPEVVLTKEECVELARSLGIEGVDTSVYATGLRMLGSKKSPTDSEYLITEYNKEVCSKSLNEFEDAERLLAEMSIATNEVYEMQLTTLDNVDDTGQRGVKEEKVKDHIMRVSRNHFEQNKLKRAELGELIEKENGVYVMQTNNKYCNVISREHRSNRQCLVISKDGVCMVCQDPECRGHKFPKELIQVPELGKLLFGALNNSVVVGNNNNVQTNLTIHVTSPKRGGNEDDMFSDEKIDERIFDDPEMTDLVNKCLDGHNPFKLSELFKKHHDNFAFNKRWYYFDGNAWRTDEDTVHIKKLIAVDMPKIFQKVLQHYSKGVNQTNTFWVRNVKSLNRKLNAYPLVRDIIKFAEIFYQDTGFVRKLNRKKDIVPFENGVFDLKTKGFRKAKKEDYVQMTVGYNYNESVCTEEVQDFLQKVLSNQNIRKYVLKKMAECLNGNIPNTNFMIMTGSGANGKSQLLNLMRMTMGDFGEKVEVTLLTRKRNNANEANTEKMKLINKRFAYLSEPEYKEKFNIGLLKELTGSEEIVARGLYQDSQKFVMEAKLYLACNDLPEVNGEDSALWRRIRVIEFKSKFVDEPRGEGEFLVDKTLQNQMNNDIKWRQAFMKLLLESYYKEEEYEPMEIQNTTAMYREDSDANAEFVKKYMVRGQKEVILWSEIWNCYQEWHIEEYQKQPNKREVKRYFENKVFFKKDMTLKKANGRGWAGWKFREMIQKDFNQTHVE